MNDLKGSLWRKWDLHFHTPSSYDYQDKTVKDEDIVKTLTKNQISVVAITDHHVMDIARINNLKKLGREVGLTILPGIEFLADARGKDPIHFIGIFSENCNLDYIWGQIENSTAIKQIKGAGKKINEVYCDLTETIKLVKDLGGIVSIHAGEKSNSIENITHSLPHATAQKTDIASIVDIYELGKETDQLGYKTVVFPAINKTIPMVICSDNHNINKYSTKQNCWLKADPTFEGLKQIIYEPEHRVYIGENPALNHKKLKIESFTITNSSKFQLVDQEIPLNSNLVSIIGGRGSGKSALLECLTYCFGLNKNNSTSNTEFTDYISHLKQNNAAGTLKVEYSGLDNEKLPPYSKEIHNPVDDNCNYPLLYLGQNEIEEYANNSTKIHELAFEAILKNSGFPDKINSVLTEIKSYEAELTGLNNETEACRLQLTSYNIDKTINDKAKLEKEITLLSSDETKIILEKLSNSRTKKDNHTKATNIIEKIIRDLEKHNADYIATLKELNQVLPLTGVKDILLSFDFGEALENSRQALEKLNNSDIISDHEKNILEAEKQLAGNTEISATYFDGLKSQIESLDNWINLYKREEDYLKSNIKLRHEQLSDFDDLFADLETYYTEAITVFTENNADILSALRLTANISFNQNKLIDDLFDKVDKRKIKDRQKFKTDILKIPAGIGSDHFYYDWVKQFEENEENFNFFYGGKKTFEEIAYQNYLQLETIIKYEVEPGNFRPLNKLSLGQKGTVLLKLFLSLGNNCPIIIDQPEDHLDNHFIYSDLVSTLRRAKEKRQIILVTHDANIVVNGDSEQIIIAEYKNDSINYSLSGSIENLEVKNAMTKILEGGNEAFIKREKKYQIH